MDSFSFRIQGVPTNNLAPMKNCPGGGGGGCKVTYIGCGGMRGVSKAFQSCGDKVFKKH